MLARTATVPLALPALSWLLRLGTAACFIGHGAFGLLRKDAWLAYFEMFGIGPAVAHHLMPVVGAVDVLIGIAALIRPARAVFLYAAGWALFTAALRPLAGEGIWELLERAGNYGVPIALLVLAWPRGGSPRWFAPLHVAALTPQATWRTFRVLQATTALLLLGHGALALGGKPLLATHAASIGLAPASALVASGALEVALAIACFARPRVALFLLIAVWKLATESLFLVAGEPAWEFIERGGSYATPLAAALLLGRMHESAADHEPAAAPAHTRASPRARTSLVRAPLLATLVAAGSLGAADAAHAQRRLDAVPDSVLVALRGGGYLLACRHGITDHDFTSSRPHDFADPSTQRTLTADGEAQMRRVGDALRRLGLVFHDVRASPYHRNVRSAELMFGHAVIDDALYGQGKDEARRALFAPVLRSGENRALVTHQSVLRAQVRTMDPIEEGDCLVIAHRSGRPLLLAHLSAAAW